MKNKITPVSFLLKGIKTEQFALFEEKYNPKSKDTKLGVNLKLKLDPNNLSVGIFMGFDLIQNKDVFLKIEVSCHFAIKEESWRTFIKENNTIVLPSDFLIHLAVITTGTTRGVLFAKTESTPFSRHIIPTLDISEIIKEDVTFKILPKDK